MALTRVETTDLSGTLANTITETAAAAVAAVEALPPKIANVQVANSSWSALDDTAVDPAGGYIILNGSNYDSGCIVTIDGTSATSVTRVSNTVLRVQVPAKTANSYTVYVVNPDGGTAIKLNGLTYSQFPAWSTGTTLTGQVKDVAISLNLAATSDSSVTYSLAAGSSLPAGTTLASNGLFSGTITGIEADTTYTFSVEATDAENQNQSRTFSVTVTMPNVNYTGLYQASSNTNFLGLYVAGGGVEEGSSLTVSCGQVLMSCTFGAIGKHATIVAHNGAGNVMWSKTDIVKYQTGLAYYNTHTQGVDLDRYMGNLSSDTQWGQYHAVDSSDNVYLTYCGDQSDGANTRLYINKFNSSGTRLWTTELKQTTANVSVSSLAYDDGRLIIGCHRATAQIPLTSRQTMAGGDGAPYLVFVNATSGAIISEFDMQIPYITKIKPYSGNSVILTGAYYGYSAIAITNATPGNTNPCIYGRRYQSATSPSMMYDVDTAANGAVFSLGTAGNGSSLMVHGWLDPNLNDNQTYTWATRFANSDTGYTWVPGRIRHDGQYVYIVASQSVNSTLSGGYGYVMRLHASNGAVDYQRMIANIQYGAAMTGLSVNGNNMVISGVTEVSNTADSQELSSFVWRVAANGYTGGGSTVTFTVGAADGQGTSYLTYGSTTHTPNTTNAYNYGDACTYSLGHLSTPGNTFTVNTTANSVMDVLEGPNYSGDPGNYYFGKVSNTTSNVVVRTM